MTSPRAAGHLVLILHAHLPFVRHPEQPRYFEESWFFEAVLECYLPLLDVLDGWERDSIPGTLTLSISPTLAAMLRDEVLLGRLRAHLANLEAFAESEEIRAHLQPARRAVASFYRERLRSLALGLEARRNDLPAAFQRHAAAGRLELITCPATHPTLPLLLDDPGSLRAQLLTALEAHAETFGAAPAGMWLPECAWESGLEPHLADAGIRWTVLDTHGLLHAMPPPRQAVFAPVRTPQGIAMFGRDPRSARQVWSRHGGYPGDPRYREFHRDVGQDAEWEYVRPHLHGSEQRGFTGLKFHRVTGPGEAKELYDRAAALAAVREHAAHFVAERIRMIRAAAPHMASPPVLVAPYDAELFGHWWFEGPEFLDAVAREAAAHAVDLRLSSPSALLAELPEPETVQPAASTWGEGGHLGVWLDPENAWMEVPLRKAGRRLTALAVRFADGTPDPVTERRLRQATRELLLAQSSDWPFLARMGTAGTYPRQRFQDHIAAVHRLADQIDAGTPTEADPLLVDLEQRHNLFPGVEWRHLARSPR